ncbi:hypothetical protein B0I35DRAFT_185849 [Stachybotrys elegans]|uniref:Extracellular membrane protein CFEM domain-containing protein n=1 Tax=Stachybotrys elegans TaxID=80388 RepID=A0A8K0SW17_9HYPO|nr:hypothetical protein B0I35DRAFT_185849 [Stachybotrys elegans]
MLCHPVLRRGSSPRSHSPILAIALSLLSVDMVSVSGLEGNGQPFEARQNNDLIDPVRMPDCRASTTCWTRGEDPPPICPLVDGPCPDDASSSDNGGSSCGTKQYSRDCYCNLHTGLYCAWTCTWSEWFHIEDWFAEVCKGYPAPEALDLSTLPGCIRGCLNDEIFQYGCLTMTSNCFCGYGSLFNCQKRCSDSEERSQIAGWLEEACDVSADVASRAAERGSFTISPEAFVAPTGTRIPNAHTLHNRPLHWDEIFLVSIVCLTVAVGIASVVWSWRMRLLRVRRDVHRQESR